MIDEYSDLEHINVWPCRLEIKISYENLLGFYRKHPSSIDFINRERFNYFIQSGWKLLEKVKIYQIRYQNIFKKSYVEIIVYKHVTIQPFSNKYG